LVYSRSPLAFRCGKETSGMRFVLDAVCGHCLGGGGAATNAATAMAAARTKHTAAIDVPYSSTVAAGRSSGLIALPAAASVSSAALGMARMNTHPMLPRMTAIVA
jgi:hypothetical protein